MWAPEELQWQARDGLRAAVDGGHRTLRLISFRCFVETGKTLVEHEIVRGLWGEHLTGHDWGVFLRVHEHVDSALHISDSENPSHSYVMMLGVAVICRIVGGFVDKFLLHLADLWCAETFQQDSSVSNAGSSTVRWNFISLKVRAIRPKPGHSHVLHFRGIKNHWCGHINFLHLKRFAPNCLQTINDLPIVLQTEAIVKSLQIDAPKKLRNKNYLAKFVRYDIHILYCYYVLWIDSCIRYVIRCCSFLPSSSQASRDPSYSQIPRSWKP